MRLLLVRHGETVDNVGGVWAGITDSALTAHGVLQTARLGSYLADTGVKISHIYSSDLQRAFKTAEAARLAQSQLPPETLKLVALREQDFGSREGKSYRAKEQSENDVQAEPFQAAESPSSMKARAEGFVTAHLVRHFEQRAGNETVVVVAHGIILGYLWRAVLAKFTEFTDTTGQTFSTADVEMYGTQHRFGGWSNTGYYELEINHKNSTNASTPAVPTTRMPHLSLRILAMNKQDHLKGLKKTRGGIGNSQHDDKQRTVDSFFKRQ